MLEYPEALPFVGVLHEHRLDGVLRSEVDHLSNGVAGDDRWGGTLIVQRRSGVGSCGLPTVRILRSMFSPRRPRCLWAEIALTWWCCQEVRSRSCLRALIRAGLSLPVGSPPISSGASTSSSARTGRTGLRSSVAIQKTWVDGRRWLTSPVPLLPLRPMSSLPPRGLSVGWSMSIDSRAAAAIRDVQAGEVGLRGEDHGRRGEPFEGARGADRVCRERVSHRAVPMPGRWRRQ